MKKPMIGENSLPSLWENTGNKNIYPFKVYNQR